jgi:TolB-like protein/DNA-binding winged helix-turn-helix (wHTH) protein/tetratricopeptide (TPR) repeat protein
MPAGFESMPATNNEPLQIGDWLVDPRDDSLTRGSERVKIEPRTMRLLMRLAQSPGTVISQDELLESVWAGVVVGTASVYQSMSQLRKVLGDSDDPPRYIETVARKGYRLIARVASPATAAAAVLATPAFVVSAPADETADKHPQPQLGWVAIAAAAAVAVMAAVWRFSPQLDAIPEVASIVVLPFVDLTSGQKEQIFCDGLTEETSNWLAQVPTLHVVARTSAFSYRNRNADVRAIGRELNTSHVLEGSLRRSNDQLRITVQLIDTRTGFHLWSDSYDVEPGDVLKVQEQIARSVVGSLELRMTADIENRFAGRRSQDSEAQRLFLIAKSHEARLEGPSNEQAIALYRQALEKDPQFALAKIWLAHAISNRRYFSNRTIESLAPEFEPLLAAAAASSPQLEDLYVVRGKIRVQQRRREEALADLRHALEMSPNSRAAASALGYYHLTNGEPRDALTYYTISSGLDPRVSDLHAYRCTALTQLAQFDAAESACERARSLEPESPIPYSLSSDLEAARGNLAGALKWNAAALKHGDDIAEIYGMRAGWLLTLGLLPDAGAVYQRARLANPESSGRNASLMAVGSAAAIDRDGEKGLEEFIESSGVADSQDWKLLFEIANSALMVRNTELANRYVERALASPILRPEDLGSPFQIAYGRSYLLITAAALRARGDTVGAAKRLDELAALIDRQIGNGMQTYGLYDIKAQLAAMRGQPDAAVSELRRALQLGWSDVWLAEHQPYYEALRDRADYRELLAAARAKNAATAASIRSLLVAPLTVQN